MMVRTFLIVVGVLAFLNLATHAIADVQAPMFPKWQAVTPTNMLDPVPEIISISLPGSVASKNQPKPQIVGCPIVEGGKTVAWSMSCFLSALRGGIREKL